MHLCSDLLQRLRVSQLNVTITDEDVNNVINKLQVKNQCQSEHELAIKLGIKTTFELYRAIQDAMKKSLTRQIQFSIKEQLFEQLITLFCDDDNQKDKTAALENAVFNLLQQYPIELNQKRVQQQLEKEPPTSDIMIAAKAAMSRNEEYQQICSKVMEEQIIEELMAHASVTQQHLSFTQLHSKKTNQIPVVTINTDNKCHYCSAKHCCHYITQKIPAPESQEDFDHLLWQVSHKNISVFKDSTGWYLMIETPCEHLTSQGQCNIYQHRPQVCREYKNTFCEFDYANDTSHFIHFFADYDAFLAYYNNIPHKKTASR